ncbi:putative holin-like toxin [Oceanobacillus luteolus]|uniref:Holin-like toxin n=1 Tax=Oceanobacillus luteolus TaxID=1274358 RepID=A0ABW4HPB0_9BACI|nr:putative holin-like toxin [Oceanobacillus luteolus]MCM3740353.1 putative holin-like toxin [Oceanobacillus luteolus]
MEIVETLSLMIAFGTLIVLIMSNKENNPSCRLAAHGGIILPSVPSPLVGVGLLEPFHVTSMERFL